MGLSCCVRHATLSLFDFRPVQLFMSTLFEHDDETLGFFTAQAGGDDERVTVVVLAVNGTGNRDPGKFPEPDKCLIDRDARDHLAFGSGAHVCIGRHYARIMIETCLETMLQRIPDYAVAADFAPDYTASEARALKSLPVSFTPRPR